jgi:hypothetical protein
MTQESSNWPKSLAYCHNNVGAIFKNANQQAIIYQLRYTDSVPRPTRSFIRGGFFPYVTRKFFNVFAIDINIDQLLRRP